MLGKLYFGSGTPATVCSFSEKVFLSAAALDVRLACQQIAIPHSPAPETLLPSHQPRRRMLVGKPCAGHKVHGARNRAAPAAAKPTHITALKRPCDVPACTKRARYAKYAEKLSMAPVPMSRHSRQSGGAALSSAARRHGLIKRREHTIDTAGQYP